MLAKAFLWHDTTVNNNKHQGPFLYQCPFTFWNVKKYCSVNTMIRFEIRVINAFIYSMLFLPPFEVFSMWILISSVQKKLSSSSRPLSSLLCLLRQRVSDFYYYTVIPVCNLLLSDAIKSQSSGDIQPEVYRIHKICLFKSNNPHSCKLLLPI